MMAEFDCFRKGNATVGDVVAQDILEIDFRSCTTMTEKEEIVKRFLKRYKGKKRIIVVKKQADKNGKSKYICVTPGSASFGERYARVLQDGMVSIDQADNLVVIKTVSGMAMAVAAAIDALEIEEIVGSIAGDDTIMCAVRTADLVPAVIEKISNK